MADVPKTKQFALPDKTEVGKCFDIWVNWAFKIRTLQIKQKYDQNFINLPNEKWDFDII